MFNPHQKFTGTGYTRTVALLALGLVFTPCALMMSRPIEYATVSVAAACGILCLSLAWASWKKSSQLSIPSILDQPERTNNLSLFSLCEKTRTGDAL